MKKTPDENVIKAWMGLIRAQKATLKNVEMALKNSDLPSLDWYDVLWELELASPDGVRPFELEKRLLLPQYGLSRLLNRLDDAGHIRRTPIEEDGRGQMLYVTASGRKLRKRMWPVYGAAIQRAVGERLGKNEAKTLGVLLHKLSAI